MYMKARKHESVEAWNILRDPSGMEGKCERTRDILDVVFDIILIFEDLVRIEPMAELREEFE